MPSGWKDIPRVPIQRLRGRLVASVQIELSDETLRRFQADLLEEVRASRADAVVLDLSGVQVLDSTDFESALRTLRMSRAMGALPVIVGIRPGIAASLVEFGIESGDVHTFSNLERAIEWLDHRSGAGIG
ncbi:MAG: STAS domain-containing protein [Phycisphaeraceae bacterium]|nr:STAS domain-containing protein [Phycisphaeraceae bacterium]